MPAAGRSHIFAGERLKVQVEASWLRWRLGWGLRRGTHDAIIKPKPYLEASLIDLTLCQIEINNERSEMPTQRLDPPTFFFGFTLGFSTAQYGVNFFLIINCEI